MSGKRAVIGYPLLKKILLAQWLGWLGVGRMEALRRVRGGVELEMLAELIESAFRTGGLNLIAGKGEE